MEYQYFLDYYNDFPFIIKLVWVISAIMFCAIVLLLIYLKITRTFLATKERETLKFKKEYEPLMVKYIYSGNGKDNSIEIKKEITQKIKRQVPIRLKRKIIIEMLFDLLNEVSGEMSNSIKTLYYKTGLIDYALVRLKNKNWYIKAKVIDELARFNIDEVKDDIYLCINHPRKEVRKEAHLYLVTLFGFEGLTFLNDLKTLLSEWEQVQLLEVMYKSDNNKISDITPWLKSSNNSVVLFALKLAKIYSQYEVKDVLMDLLSHKDEDIRIVTIEVLSSLYVIEAKEMLKANFNEMSSDEQISYFHMMEKLIHPSDEPFLEKHLIHKNFEIQLMALKMLKTINLYKYVKMSVSPSAEKEDSVFNYNN